MLTLTNRIDMRPGAVPLVIHLGQYDSDFSLVFELYSSAGNFTVESGTTAMIRGTKTDGHAYDADATIDVSTKTVTVTGSEQMTAAKGRNVYELVLTKSGKVLSTANFILDVERAAMDADTIASESVLKELNAIIAGAETATEAATNAASAADRAEDAADSVSSASAQIATNTANIATNTADISDLKADLDDKVDLPKEITDVPITVHTGYYTTSGFTSASGFKAAKEEVAEGETLLITGSGNTFAYAYYFVNDSGDVISKADTALEMSDYKIVVPNGATYVEINTSGTNKNIGLKRVSYDTSFNINNLINSVDYITENTIEPVDEKKELTLTWDSGYRVNGTTISPNVSYLSTVVPVLAGEVYDVIIYFKESWFYGVYLYDSNMTLVARYITGDGTNTSRYEQEIAITTNGYMVVNATAWNRYKGIFKVVTLSANNRIEKLENTPWTGKTIWWCGTSIPANGAPVGEENLSYPAYVGKLLGANVINKAISSSCARRGWKNKETESDPYGWTDVAWQNVFLAMGANLAEKQDLIDNYSTWKNVIGGDFDGSGSDGTGTGKPDTLTQEWIDKINASSYENILIPYLDGTHDMPDLFVFDHGHNDYGNGETFAEMTTQPTDAYDRSTFIGAMSFFFEQIFVANPHAKIVLISHYANDTGKQNAITTAQNNLANLWDLPIFDIYEKLGWSQQVITTTGYWDTSTFKWINSGGNSRQIKMLNVHLRDGLHPSSDQSGKAIMQYGYEIAQYFKNNIVANEIKN